MSHDTTTGEIRPSTPSTTTDGTASEIRWVREGTLVKRLRRKLASMDLALRRNRQGSADRAKYGEWTAIDPKTRAIIWHNVLLCEMARDLGVLAENERIEEPMSRGWRFYIARQVAEDVGDRRSIHVVRITKDYTTPQAAWKAAEGFEGDDLIEVGYLADRQEGEDDTP